MDTDHPSLIEFEEEGVERTLTAEAVVEKEMHDPGFNKWLMAVQCALGPVFCATVLFCWSSYLLFSSGTELYLQMVGNTLV
jgi:sodium/potassium/calcium exchanger 6